MTLVTQLCPICKKTTIPCSEMYCAGCVGTPEAAKINSFKCFDMIREFNKTSVNHPKHYNTGKIEVIEFIEDQQLGYHLGNAVKYLCRAGRKDPDKFVEDLEKAIWYVKRRIELKAETPRRPNEMNQ